MAEILDGKIKDIDTMTFSPDLVYKDINIRYIPRLQLFDPPLTKQLLAKSVFLESQRDLPPEIQEYMCGVDEEIAKRRAAGAMLRNNPGYGMKKIIIEKESTLDGVGMQKIPTLIFEPAMYGHQIMFGERMDEHGTIRTNRGMMSVRDYCTIIYGIDFDHFHWQDVERLPIIQRGANVIGVITPVRHGALEKCVVVPLRSAAVAIKRKDDVEAIRSDGPIWEASLCAESMQRPQDAGGDEQRAPSPFNTAIRALHRELNIADHVDYDSEVDLKMIGLAYDSYRCQPVSIFSVEVNSRDFSEIKASWRFSKDNEENVAIIPIRMHPDEFRDVLMQRKTFNGRPVVLFSNHQRVWLLVLALHHFGNFFA